MGFFVPVLAAIGGGSALAGGAVVATAAAGSLAAYQTYQAGSAQSAQYKLQIKQEQDSARGREIERKRTLLRALANQNAVAGAQGVAMSGAKEAIARQDIRFAADDLLTDRAATGQRVSGYRAAASNAKKAGTMGAVTSLLDTGAKVVGMK
jgi:hypothetical protein